MIVVALVVDNMELLNGEIEVRVNKLKRKKKITRIVKIIVLSLLLALLLAYIVMNVIYNNGNFSITLYIIILLNNRCK